MFSRFFRYKGIPRSFTRAYHKNVLDHYENPRNVGSFDKSDPNVGTGLVGAPACIHGDTMIAVANGERCMSVKEIFKKGKDIPVWSYNLNKNIYEIKLARVIKGEKKRMVKIIFDDQSILICTPDHKFLTRIENKYVECDKLLNELIMPFKGYVECDFKVIKIEELDGIYDSYDLQVEENNNFAVITKITKNIQSGIIVKNCGDVMKLQIKVDEHNNIVDTCFKTYGCGSALASSSLATEWIKGKNTEQAMEIKNSEIAQHLRLPPIKLHCSMLAEDAIKAAIDDWQKKQQT